MRYKDLFDNKTVFFDGGMGTMLMKRGMKQGMRSDLMNVQFPETVEQIHREYVEAGSQILCTNTFSTSSPALKGTGYTAEEVIRSAVDLAKKAAEGRALVAMDIGPTGELMDPLGDLTFELAYGRFKEQATLGEKAGADLITVETMSSPDELRAAVLAASDNTALDILATMTFRADGRTFLGYPVEEFAALANELPVIAAGMNCSEEPAAMLPAAERLAALLKKPLIMKLNAGIPNGDGSYTVSPEMYAEQLRLYLSLNVKLVGGCCGTTPEYIRAIRKVFC